MELRVGIKKKVKSVKQLIITECYCDKCKEGVYLDGMGLDFQSKSGMLIVRTGGYMSKHDTDTVELVLCDDCLFELALSIKGDNHERENKLP